MNRKLITFICLLLMFSFGVLKENVLAYSYPFDQSRNMCEVGPSNSLAFEVAVAKSDNTFSHIDCYSTYSEAVDAMHNYNSDKNNVAVVIETKNDEGVLSEIVNAEYAVVDLNTKGDKNTYVYDSSGYSYRYTYINGYYGSGAAFLDGIVNVVSTGNEKVLEITGTEVRIRTDHSLAGTILAVATSGDIFVILDEYQGPEYLWYKVEHLGSTAWIAGSSVWSTTYYSDEAQTTKGIQMEISGYSGYIKQFENGLNYEIIPISQIAIDDYYYISEGDLRHRFSYKGTTASLRIGPALSFMEEGVNYYSFDGNYFYDDYTLMIDDYRTGNYNNSVNSEDIYYNYYMYLPNRNKSGYTANDINHLLESKGYRAKPDKNDGYYNLTTGATLKTLPTNLSVLYNEGASFIASQELYGVNAFQTFALAINESDWGRSAIAVNKSNVFGQQAYDSCPYTCATIFPSVADSINEHASGYVSSYSTPTGTYYFGSHYGNKNSGMGVNYASDPYWGEKMAANYYSLDKTYGLNDYESNVVGIKETSSPVRVRKEATTLSDYIYELTNKNTNVSKMPVIVVDVEKGEELEGNDIWYKIQTDPPLDSDQNITTANYDWDYSIGYIHSSLIYISKPVINASDIFVEKGSLIDYLDYVSVYDSNDGFITEGITIDDSSVDLNTVGTYDLTYSYTNSNNKKTSYNVLVIVTNSSAPTITASDIVVYQGEEVNLLENVTATDTEDGDVTSSITTSGDYDINTIGSYEITYKAVDSNSNEGFKKVTLNVIAKPNTLPIIKANDIYINVGESIDPLDYVLSYDSEDGTLTNLVSLSGSYDINSVGEYNITYSVTDSDSNIVNKQVKLVVEKEYIDKTGEFYFEKFIYNESNETFDFGGFLVIEDIANSVSSNIEYDLVLIDGDNRRYVFDLARWTDNVPFAVPSYDGLDLSGAWFEGEVDLKDVPEGDYTAYVRARSGDYEASKIVSNIFLKPMATRVSTSSGRGYQVRTNYLVNEMPMEIFVRDEGLITTTEPSSVVNMFNFYETVSLDSGLLKIKGGSYSVDVDYSTSINVERYIILENQETYERVKSSNIGYIDNGPYKITLRYNDGFSKTRGWYDGSIDISSLAAGNYAIYINTITSSANDYGELTDVFFKDLPGSYVYNNKRYTLSLNVDERYRIELMVEDL